MSDMTWTKEGLSSSVNQRVDQGKLISNGGQYIFPHDITDYALQEFQRIWDDNACFPLVREKEFERLYQAITSGF